MKFNKVFTKWVKYGLFFVYFRPFLITISIILIEKSLDGVLGIQTCGSTMVGSDETTELWRPPNMHLISARTKISVVLLLKNQYKTDEKIK